MLILGVAYEIFIRAQDISTYPFSLGWSETSRFYYGSLYFAQPIYGTSIPLSTLHPTRYFLQSLAFLVPNSDLTFSRLWQLLLWIVLTGAASITLSRRAFPPPFTGGARGGPVWLLAAWLFLFLLRVGVYYHLEIMVILPVLFVSAKHPWRSLAAVIFASAWAGVSRVNWFPVPTMLAVAIYLLEEPINHDPLSETSDTKTQSNSKLRAFVTVPAPAQLGWLNYLKLPAIWAVVGILTALATQAIYIPLSGNANNIGAFGSSFTSDLLWNRLWPNDSFSLGVLPGILIVSGPLLIVLLYSRLGSLHPLRRFGLLAMLTVLFVGGLVVSVKIGGGGDLHNMDAYAVFVGLLAAYCLGDKVQGESGNATGAKTLPWPVTAIALLIPLIFLIPALSPFPQLNEKFNQSALNQLTALTNQASPKGSVLFINERHLLTFGKIRAPLVPEYEAVTLMEMAMSNNQPYLQQFYADLKNHRFAAIIAGKQNVGVKEEGAFSDENNIWNARVSPYILCYYEPAAELEADESKIEFFVPRTEACQ